MIDQKFIQDRIIRGEEAIKKAKEAFSYLSLEQFNWKPSIEKWSVAECLEHLIIADRCYIKDLTEIGNGSYKMNIWERYSPFSRLLGNALKEQMKEVVKKKMVTHKILNPTSSSYDLNLLNEYLDNITIFTELV